ncbi:endonuclease domain-containing protein [Lichenibacterium dinghuense]|uniref:endonuclease domain-containing protein n=1 Tax=Lichenibacterium dinghuense TaxID=2895977 RepID=UPI001F338D68|nr:DUF559 domain-containing protein [Lichenibacterium sp. 6Y81]
MARWVPNEQTTFARRLRREMTTAETMVWRALRDGRVAGAKFRRQVPVGPYVADFLCRDAKLVVELDGAPHDDPEQRVRDAERDAWLGHQGFRVLRFSNDLAIGGTQILVQRVEAALKTRRPGG